MEFDWTVNVGNVLTAIVLLLGFLAAHRQNIERFQRMETKLETLYIWFRSNVLEK